MSADKLDLDAVRARVEAATSYQIDPEALGHEMDVAAFVADLDAKEALARTDVPALLAEIERLTRERDAVVEAVTRTVAFLVEDGHVTPAGQRILLRAVSQDGGAE